EEGRRTSSAKGGVMSRYLLLVAALVFGAVAMVSAYLARELPAPGLVAAEPVHDFGDLSQGDTVAHEFELVNRFNQPVTIRNVIKSCGCTQAECSRTEVGPGERVTVKAEWKVGASRGRSSVDLVALVGLADGRLARTDLRLAGNVVPDIAYE